MFQGSCMCRITPTAVALLRSHACKGMWKKDKGKIPGDWSQTSLAHGQSCKIWIVVSKVLHLGQWAVMCWWEKVKYCLVGSRLCIAFQRNSWIFLGHCNFQIQYHNCLFKGNSFWWYKNFDAELTEQVPLLWGHMKVFESLAICAMGIPLISCLSCGGRGTWRESKVQVWLVLNVLTRLFSSFSMNGPLMRLQRVPPRIQWSSHTLIVCPSPTIHFIPDCNYWIPSNKAFQIWDPLEFLALSNRLVCGKYLASKTWS